MTKIQLKRSSVLLSGAARVPAANQLDFGEVALNYNSADPQLFFKNSSGSVVSFFEPYAPLTGATFTGDCVFNTDVDFDGSVTIKGDSTNGSGKLTLTCEQNTHSVNIKAPAHSAAANYTLTLPSSTGTSGQVLITDGSGGLNWAISSMSLADQTKLNGIETGATADQTASEILNLLKTVDDSGSGLDADVLDGQTGSYYLNYNNLSNKPTIPTNNNQLTNGAGYLTSADGGNANLLDSLDSSQFLRSDASDTYSGTLTINGFLLPTGTNIDRNLKLRGGTAASSDAGISLYSGSNNWVMQLYGESATPAYGFLNGNWASWDLRKVVNGQLQVRVSGTEYTVWHSGNDGSGSGLDADLWDGNQFNSYLNQAVLTSSGPTFSNVYNNSWFRNNDAGEGLYNQSTARHFYSAGSNYWHIDSNRGLIFYTNYNATEGNGSYRKGYIYHNDDGFGMLSSAGSWSAMAKQGAGTNEALCVGFNSTSMSTHSTARMTFGATSDFGGYHFGTERENYGGNYTKLDLRWHTGIRLGAHINYGGIRFYTSETVGTMIFQVNGTSEYLYKYRWFKTDATGWFSSTNGAHFYPSSSTYGAWRLSGSRNGYTGITCSYNSNDNVIGMFDSGGNGGTYSQTSGIWHFYWHKNNACAGINGSTTSSSYALYVTGGIYSSGDIVSASDERKKTNITPIKNALSKVLDLRGVTYNKLKLDKTAEERTDMGVIAQEIEKVVPEVVHYAEDVDEYSVSYGNITALLIEAVKELKIELNELKASLS